MFGSDLDPNNTQRRVYGMGGGGGADSGQAANPKGIWATLEDSMGSLLGGGADPATVAGGGVVSGLGGMAEIGGRVAENARKIITDGALGDYPGYGSLWTYDNGLHVETKGWAVLGAAAVALYLVLKG